MTQGDKDRRWPPPPQQCCVSLMLICFLLAFASHCVSFARADVYLHNPRGSSNRGCEVNDARNNGNRLFNSQNNAAGGYACPRAMPFACYRLTNETERIACNSINADQNYDDISGLSDFVDEDGVLHPDGTRTPRMYFYEGSVLEIEWTSKAGCNDEVNCDVILQYACEDTLADDCGEPGGGKQCGPRDGVPITNSAAPRDVIQYESIVPGPPSFVSRGARDGSATATIPFSTNYSAQSDPRFGRHEGISYYLKCLRRERNRGLWVADQPVSGDATKTRQGPGGTRNGFECPEEAEYYPYWTSSPWKDIAILSNYRTDQCASIVAESQNVKEKYECQCPSCLDLLPIHREGCETVGGTWVAIPSHNISAPYCGPAPRTFSNQLGAAVSGDKVKPLSSYKWTLPQNLASSKTCVLRIRYNITSGDPLDSNNVTSLDLSVYGTAAQNGSFSFLKDRSINENSVYKSFAELSSNAAASLGLAINTNQVGRTFQDRSWSFEIRPAPTTGECAGKQIYNLNVRGKRGNIIQVFPSVQYDYSPNEIVVTSEDDCIHVQWTGSDYNPARNANDAYGGPPDPQNLNNGRADRSNLVQMYHEADNYPVANLDQDFNVFNTTRDRKIRLAFIDQPIEDPDQCMSIPDLRALSEYAQRSNDPEFFDKSENFLNDGNDRDRYWKNCGKLSGAVTPYFDGGLFVPGPVGKHAFMCTRSNSFSNRRMVGTIRVVPPSTRLLSESPSKAPSRAPSRAPTVTPACKGLAENDCFLFEDGDRCIWVQNSRACMDKPSTRSPTATRTIAPTVLARNPDECAKLGETECKASLVDCIYLPGSVGCRARPEVIPCTEDDRAEWRRCQRNARLELQSLMNTTATVTQPELRMVVEKELFCKLAPGLLVNTIKRCVRRCEDEDTHDFLGLSETQRWCEGFDNGTALDTVMIRVGCDVVNRTTCDEIIAQGLAGNADFQAILGGSDAAIGSNLSAMIILLMTTAFVWVFQ